MKKFVSQIALFLLFPILLCVLVLFSPLKRKYAWNSLPTDCDNRGAWIWSRLYVDTTSIDIAFLGTSHTLNGIQDTMISRLLSEKKQERINAVNLAYCRFGNELNYVIAKDLFATKKPKIVIIEVNEKFGTASHPVYPYFAETKELVQPASLVQQAYGSNLYNGFLARLSQFRSSFFHSLDTIVPIHVSYGYRGFPTAMDDPAQLVPPDKKQSHQMGAWRKFTVSYPQAWISDLVQLCRSNHAQVFFLYIPAYHDQPVPIEGMDFYTSMAKVLLPPEGLFSDKTMWRDKNHLDDKGANVLATWFSSAISLEK
jgi:hypothetical protein